MKPTKSQTEFAAKNGFHLLSLKLDGRPAEQGSVEMVVPLGPETVRKLWDYINDVLVKPEVREK